MEPVVNVKKKASDHGPDHTHIFPTAHWAC